MMVRGEGGPGIEVHIEKYVVLNLLGAQEAKSKEERTLQRLNNKSAKLN